MSDLANQDRPPLWLLFVLLAVVGAISTVAVVAYRRHKSAPTPAWATVKCPHCGKDVPLRVVTPEDNREKGR